tara:strand:+ start:4265 stop:5218 length:954 start_codon:yes stop_codon:yes gene_type:complete
MKHNPIKICVVGGGNWGRNHLETLNKIGNLGGLVEKDELLIKEFKKKFPFIKVFKNVETALKENLFQGFIVATPAKTHFAISKQILMHGANLLVEKPFCQSLREAKILVNLAAKKKLCLMVGHILLFHDAVRKIKEFINKNRLGKINYIYINRLNLGRIRNFEDVFWSLGPHDVSIINYLLDKLPTKVKSESHSFLQKGISDVHITNLTFKNGIKAHIFNSWYNPFKEHRLVVAGSKAIIDFRDDEESFLRLYDMNINKKDFEILSTSKNFKNISFKKTKPLEEELTYFVKNIKQNRKAEISGPKSAIEVTKIMTQL